MYVKMKRASTTFSWWSKKIQRSIERGHYVRGDNDGAWDTRMMLYIHYAVLIDTCTLYRCRFPPKMLLIDSVERLGNGDHSTVVHRAPPTPFVVLEI